MPASRAQIRRAKVIGHKVDFGDDVVVTFWYDMNKITDGWMRDWREHEQEANAPRLNEMLADLIERWDVFEDDECTVPTPLSAESIGDLFSLPAKLHLMQELFTASVPSRAEGEVSSAPSLVSPPEQSMDSTPPPLESPQTLPNGAEPSPSPAPSASPSPT